MEIIAREKTIWNASPDLLNLNSLEIERLNEIVGAKVIWFEGNSK